MRRRGLIALWAALALLPLACAGGDEEPSAGPASTTVAATTSSSAPTETEAPPTTTTETAPTDEPADPAAIAEAAEATAAQGSARVATSVTVTGPVDLEQTFTGDGAFDFERRAGRMTIELTGGEEAEVVFVDSVAYYRPPAGTLPGGKRWLRLDLQSVADASSLDVGPLVQAAQADPSQSLLWLGALGPEVTRLGEEEVRGVPTTRYGTEVVLGLLAGHAPPGQEAEWRAYVETLRGRLGLEAIPVEIWVDADGLIRRLRHELTFAAEGTSTAATTELYDFGVQVEAEAPSPDEVAAVGDLIRP
jgi:hypothetical protein